MVVSLENNYIEDIEQRKKDGIILKKSY